MFEASITQNKVRKLEDLSPTSDRDDENLTSIFLLTYKNIDTFLLFIRPQLGEMLKPFGKEIKL